MIRFLMKTPMFLGFQKHLAKYIKKVIVHEYLVYGDKERLEISPTAVVNNALFNLSSGKVIVEDYSFFGHNVTILTGTHDCKKTGLERQNSAPVSGRDILIKEGAWIASNATIIGPCTIGEHSVVAACSLVNRDVPAYSVVAGVPAKVIKLIEDG